MSINQLIFRNLKKNIRNYYLYVFALIFSVALYFAFVTLQYDPAIDEVKASIKGAAALKAASILLVAVVAVFILYANTIFIKRRSKEIGLFQLIGMRKQKIFRILSLENVMLYFGSLVIGVFAGFSISKLVLMTLFKIVDVQAETELNFSGEALMQTVIVFCGIYLLVMVMNYTFIKKQSILSLFKATSATEDKVKRISVFQMIIGLLGILFILSGYYISTELFSGKFKTIDELFYAMSFILGTVIIGTYLFYKGSVSFVSNIIRKSKGGYLNIYEVLSLSSIMFRLKSNALLLTIITTVTALAIGLLSLCYISYYSAEKAAEQNVAADFAMTNQKDAKRFEQLLDENNISYSKKEIHVIQATFNLEQVVEGDPENMAGDPGKLPLAVVSDAEIDGIDVHKGDVIFSGYNDLLQKLMALKETGAIKVKSEHETIPLNYLGLRKESLLSFNFTSGGLPVAVVDDALFKRLSQDKDPKLQQKSSLFYGINLKDEDQIQQANELFATVNQNDQHLSLLDASTAQKSLFGLAMFIVGFLGLTFLITSGCILYFKQMDESEDEKPNYTILRKLGFTRGDLLKGIRIKQMYNFGIPLVIGLSHSYFAVQSGWFLFGAEVRTPMIIVMVLYTVLYSIFGLLSVLYGKKVIKSAL
ncbi:Bacitracin export permease protein BceB [Bacillus paralicheniformis]|uniref:Bacitracin export permease protein BceB n=4 Tax=Bacillus paralicheniformis TaxID=1648923 RepID=A0A6I7U776_9BACI|nr:MULTISPECIES: ABC transporter permease [Bacillus]KUL19450.1 bacitracin ABC transporter permease [Bacillus licheniformis LMG 6934]MBG9881844.1 bacitracin ABC transporter permease [Bacillus paralicheniformis]MBL7475914.1 ABC transporter permease [Bacillus paralicheniformis]MBX9432618.1 FtsX-like permease family protein [Bacillus paralicheniformis]MDE1359386.1 ABC transporter permease [Bacillus paralicheniformis]